jgi:hypothetical protein
MFCIKSINARSDRKDSGRYVFELEGQNRDSPYPRIVFARLVAINLGVSSFKAGMGNFPYSRLGLAPPKVAISLAFYGEDSRNPNKCQVTLGVKHVFRSPERIPT